MVRQSRRTRLLGRLCRDCLRPLGPDRAIKPGLRRVDVTDVERCPTCGAALTPGVAWCGQCFAHRSVATAAVSPVRASGGPIGGFGTAPSRAVTVAAPAAEPLVRLTRWEKTPTTFGPAGRLVATLLLLLPLGVMVVGGLADPFVWGGAGLYLAVVVPWALRDIWKAGTIRVG